MPNYICEICHCAVYQPHPEFPYQWNKCPFCGFSIRNDKKVDQTNQQSEAKEKEE